jgi:hypothetical protein
MSSSDFALLAKYIDKKAKGSNISFMEDGQRFIVKFSDNLGEEVQITFFAEEISSFAKITTSRLLSEEL